MRLRLVKEPFDNPDYIFELKHDGPVSILRLAILYASRTMVRRERFVTAFRGGHVRATHRDAGRRYFSTLSMAYPLALSPVDPVHVQETFSSTMS